MLEKVARALCERDGFKWDAEHFNETANGEEPEEQREYWRGIARTAIAAMHEPTDEMIEDGVLAYNLTGIAGGIINTAEDHVTFIFQAMLPVVAISEQQP